MTQFYRVAAAIVIAAMSACATAPETGTTIDSERGANTAAMQPVAVRKAQRPRPETDPTAPGPETIAVTFGRGIAKADGLDVTFMFNVTVYADETVNGTFSHKASGQAGTIDIEAEVTCAKLDSATGRGRLGGRIVRNNSTDPRYAAETGADVWMRLLDRNRQQTQPLVGLPVLRAGRVRSAAGFCAGDDWNDEDLHLVDPGALAIFP